MTALTFTPFAVTAPTVPVSNKPMDCHFETKVENLTLGGKHAVMDKPDINLGFDLNKWYYAENRAMHTPNSGKAGEGDGFSTVWPRDDGYVEFENIDNDSQYHWVFTIDGPDDDRLYVYLFAYDRCQLKYGKISSLSMTPIDVAP